MNSTHRLTLQKTTDDFSYQVSAQDDRRFWFRLERQPDRDIITDYFVGSLPHEEAVSLFTECYRLLGLAPQNVIVFRDILPTRKLKDVFAELGQARDLYGACGKTTLTSFGAGRVKEKLQKEPDRYNLVLTGVP